MIKLKLGLIFLISLILLHVQTTKALEKDSQKNPNIKAYQEVSVRIDKYGAQVLSNYEKNLKKIDTMLVNTKKYYQKNLELEASSSGRIGSLLERAEREKTASFQGLQSLKIQANNFKKNKNGLPSVVHRFQRDVDQAITNFDNYKAAVIDLVSEVKETSVEQKSKKDKNDDNDD